MKLFIDIFRVITFCSGVVLLFYTFKSSGITLIIGLFFIYMAVYLLSPVEENHVSKKIKTKPKKANPPNIAAGCLAFPVLLITLMFIGAFVLSKLSEETYKPGDIPGSEFHVLVDIPGWDMPEIYELSSSDEERYFDKRYPGWSFYESDTSGSIDSSFSSRICNWSVRKLSTSRRRIELRCHIDDVFNDICIYEIDNNEITPVYYKQPAFPNKNFVFTSFPFAFIISVILSVLIGQREKVPQYPPLDK